MSNLKFLIRHAGSWKGHNRLWLSPTEKARESETAATITPVVQGKFVRIDYTWAEEGKPQEGMLLVGYERQENAVTAVWTDSWHMSDKIMVCRGAEGRDDTLDVRGSYAAPPGPDWGWRILIKSGGNAFQIIMHNVTPDGREELAVEATYAQV